MATEPVSNKLKLAVALSLIAGVLILYEGLISVPYMWSGYWVHGQFIWLSSFSISLMIVSGALITVSAAFLYRNPQQHHTFGLIILLASPLSLLALGTASPRDHIPSVTITTILMFTGMVGGALSITYKHKEKQSN